MGARTNAARTEVLAAREGLADQVDRLEAAGRAAIDIPARVRREPAKMAGAAGGAAFLLLGGPGRVVRGVRRAIFGPQADLPKTMLPKEVDKTLRKLGPDGEKVRGTLEREFADYLEEKAPQRRERDLAGAATAMIVSILKPASVRLGRQLAESLLNPDAPTFGDALRRVQGQPAAASESGSPPPGTGSNAGGRGRGRSSSPTSPAASKASRDRSSGKAGG